MRTDEGGASAAPKLGPTGMRVADNVIRCREDSAASLRDLSSRLADYGRPILPSGILKIEQRQRRVDVDDLFALALALDASPATLLLNQTGGGPVELTPGHFRTAGDAWRWGTNGRVKTAAADVHMSALRQHREALRSVFTAVTETLDAGVPEPVVAAAVEAVCLGRSVAARYGPGDAEREESTNG